MEYTLVGLDVSKFQGNVDWAKAAAGQDFVIIRAGYGRFASQEDPCFKKNVEGAFAAGLPVGVYWYSYAATEAEARQEAEVCLSVIAPYRDKITLPVFFDQEYEPSIIAATKAVRTACCVAFCKVIESAGYRPECMVRSTGCKIKSPCRHSLRILWFGARGIRTIRRPSRTLSGSIPAPERCLVSPVMSTSTVRRQS